eukprot:TRINITY_DN4156_c0_g1_i1.p1 TRINITY_DN4156_c0_g1~~TRINITY_DN4156_c0_g1_i1.p1  ORF type:complete len:552 (+),score=107.83 TRINITY_DN4156_c0_g1_i1:23-1657(+)
MQDASPLHQASEEGSIDKVKTLIKKKNNVNAFDKNRWTPLHCAANGRHLEICKLLIKANADVNAVNNTETTALHYIARIPIDDEATSGKKPKEPLVISIAKMLVEKGAKVQAKNRTGLTPLHEAAYKGSEQMILLLLKSGCEINEKDKYGETPLHYAMRGAKKENIEVLLQNGASTHVKGQRGTPTDIVRETNQDLVNVVNSFKRKDKDKEVLLIVKNFEDLPEKMKSALLAMNQSLTFFESNFETLTHIIRFVARKRIVRGDPSIFIMQEPRLNFQLIPETNGYGSFIGKNLQTNALVNIKVREHQKPKKQEQNCQEALLFKSFENIAYPRFLDCYTTEEDCWIILEHIKGAKLSILAPLLLAEDEIAFITSKLLQGLGYLHRQQLIHRNFNSNNIRITEDGEVKITDVRDAVDISSGPAHGMAGDFFFMAPEMLNGYPYSYAFDVWGLGMIVLQLANGSLQNTHSPLKAMFTTATAETPPTLDDARKWSPRLVEFVASCLQNKANLRPLVPALSEMTFVKNITKPPEALKARITKLLQEKKS